MNCLASIDMTALPKRKRKRTDATTLAEWCESMARHHQELARDDSKRKQQVRSLRFKAKQFARVATVLRGITQ